jgi:HEAT repeat protein
MNYTPEQITQAVLKALETLNTPDVTKLPLQERKELAQNPNTPPEALTLLARDENSSVRWRVAQNPNTPPEILTILARDENWNVRWGVAQNPNTPPEILTHLARDENWNVRW